VAHIVVLGNGTELVALRDAANVLLEVFGSVNARYGALDYTIQRPLKAATTVILVMPVTAAERRLL
jgi:hypothetical protein